MARGLYRTFERVRVQRPFPIPYLGTVGTSVLLPAVVSAVRDASVPEKIRVQWDVQGERPDTSTR